jgi:DNA invertase Pin-like site-specific DNA recombinase
MLKGKADIQQSPELNLLRRSEWQREGIAKAKAEGVYKGRKPTARAKAEEVRKLHAEGRTPTGISKALGIGRGCVYLAI